MSITTDPAPPNGAPINGHIIEAKPTSNTKENNTPSATLAEGDNTNSKPTPPTSIPIPSPSAFLPSEAYPTAPAAPLPETSNNNNGAAPTESAAASTTTAAAATATPAIDPTTEFSGSIDTNNTIPSRELIASIADFPVLDAEGRARPFKSLYSGPNIARRVLVIFIRHFYCGNCQEYIRTLSTALPPSTLLTLTPPTTLAIIGCGSPTLIPSYISLTSSPYPIYADPTQSLYKALGMTRTLLLGPKPEYIKQGFWKGAILSVVQGVKEMGKGRVGGMGDMQQVGGEFLFVPVGMEMNGVGVESPGSEIAFGGKKEEEVEKVVSWCHRMRNTRDHAEVEELRAVLGIEGEGRGGVPVENGVGGVSGKAHAANGNGSLNGSEVEEKPMGTEKKEKKRRWSRVPIGRKSESLERAEA